LISVKESEKIWQELLTSEKKSRSGKLTRFLNAPLLYPSLMVFNYLLYPLLKKGIYLKANTFFSTPIRILLPSGTDLLLNGIKSHDSEIRLTKYLTLALKEGDTFIDVGAHHGYYSLLASVIVGDKGKIYSIEASVASFNILKENVEAYNNIETFQVAAGDKPGNITFYEYPGPYAEYNTTIQGAYTNQKWHDKVIERVNVVPILVLDDLIQSKGIEKAYIKIDVEGGEPSVLRGLQIALKEKQLIIAMEYIFKSEGGTHHEAAALLYNNNYKSYAITRNGELKIVPEIDTYLVEEKINSDNIVFLKS